MRLAVSLVTGRRIDPANVQRLVADAVATVRAFGVPGDDVDQLLDGPFADPQFRRELQDRALRRTVQRTAKVSPYYRRLLHADGINATDVTIDTFSALPLTRKADLVGEPAAFLAEGSRPVLATRSTGSTGLPVTVWLSRYETELWPALAALAGVLRGELTPSDCMQVNISSRATAAVQQDVSVCRLAGASCLVLGLIPPADSLQVLLSNPRPTLLATYPSYLAELVHAARHRGLRAEHFALRRIDVGGEVLSASLVRAAQHTLGAPVSDTFAMTEVLPVSARSCTRGHLHHDLNTGYVEVLDLTTGRPAGPGQLGTVVITPYYPYRDCMPVLRYDTRDVVRQLQPGRLSCELAGTPATSLVLGKADQLLSLPDATITPRDLIDRLEALPTDPWPVRYGIRHGDNGPLLQLTPDTLGELTPAALAADLRQAGFALDVEQAIARPGSPLRRLRSDLVEHTFTGEQRP